MRVTSKGQVTIPHMIREELGISPHSEVEFRKVGDGDYRLVRKPATAAAPGRFAAIRGSATVRLRTDEIMALTRS